MSKSIYDEAIEDLYYVIPVGYPKDMIGKTIQTKRLLDFVKQAEKQERIVQLQNDIIELQEYLLKRFYNIRANGTDYEEVSAINDEIRINKKQIKEIMK